jgi:lipoyl-dependent peroxiredoxin
METIMAIRTAEAEWNGDLPSGSGHMRLASRAFDGPYDFRSRMRDGAGTNPEELLAAAHAGCFSMALSAQLWQAGFKPERVHTKAKVHFEQRNGGWMIPRIDLEAEAVVPDIAAEVFQAQAESAKTNCPISRVLAGAEIGLQAKLVAPADAH